MWRCFDSEHLFKDFDGREWTPLEAFVGAKIPMEIDSPYKSAKFINSSLNNFNHHFYLEMVKKSSNRSAIVYDNLLFAMN